jgi:serine/threonine protein kinase
VEVCACDGPLQTAFDGPGVLDGKYRLDRRLGHGGMGVVYRAYHLGLQKRFALKLITKARDQASLARFRVEAAALGKLKHPNIVDVTDFGIDARGGGLPYLVMEYLEGSTLPDRYRVGPLPPDRALPIFESIAEGIDHAHEHGILHLDLKPGNIFVCRDESGHETVKILDFGLARFVSDRPAADHPVPTRDQRVARQAAAQMEQLAGAETHTVDISKAVVVATHGDLSGSDWHDASKREPGEGVVGDRAGTELNGRGFLGTLPYMAPEVLSGERATRASDIYSFGILIYEVLVGRRPYQGSTTEIIAGHCSGMPLPPSGLNADLPSEFDDALLPALEKLPARRPPRAADVVRGIRSAVFRSHVRTWRRKEIPRRVAASAVAAVVLPLALAPAARLAIPQQIENRSVDVRFLSSPLRAPDPRVVLVSLDEASLQADPTPLPQKADDFGRQLERVFEAGARGVAIDFLLPEAWSRSTAFSELILRHPDALTLAAFSSPSGAVIGPECLNRLTAAALGPKRASDLFAFVNLDEDADGVNRRARLSYLDQSGQERDSWASRAVRTLGDSSPLVPSNRIGGLLREPTSRFWIDHSVDWEAFRRVSWKDLGATIEREPAVFRDRLVLVGGDFAGFGGDYHRVPAGTDASPGVSGLVLQALTANTILSRFPVRELAAVPELAGTGVAAAALMVAVLLSSRWLPPALVLGTLIAIYLGASVLLFQRSLVLLPVVSPLLTAAAAVLVASLLRIVLPRVPEYKTSGS